MTRGLNTVGYYFGRRLNLFEFETGIRETFKTIKKAFYKIPFYIPPTVLLRIQCAEIMIATSI